MDRPLIAAMVATGLVLAAVAGTATAAADPPPDPGLPIPVPGGEAAPPPPPDPLYTAATETRQNPVDAMAQLIGAPTSTVMNLAPSPTGADPLAPATTLFPQYYRMPTPDMESPYLLTENAPAGPFARVDAFKGVHALLHGSLGRMPASELGEPLPGTAPPPGTNIPAGPEQFLPPPPEVVVPPAPAG
ncbi:hypothetical protein [Mycobacterium sp. DL592]|uniref:hypothetical protein n=1 Tax=Mycobacterium sp. DL592 TaxID=2675524 RepID=UPI001422CFA3|nr:hypothetical protein [Mycobacterium sp. DL592]